MAAILLLSGLNGGPRQVVFALINLTFVASILGPIGGASTLAFAIAGYGLTALAQRRQRSWLVVGLVAFVALFVYMRRYDFLTWMLPASALTSILSTIGLSFLFFKVVHVTIDAYSGTLGRIDPITYLNYALNFTTFMMGPIQRFQDFRAQWEREREETPTSFDAYLDTGLRALVGLVKVYIVAVFFQNHALQPGTDITRLSFVGLVVQSYAFWAYLYFNFSGYCDVMIGIGSLFGVRPPENFDRPFIARNISDFWQRQHRSLTLWLTDYVFSPLYRLCLRTSVLSRHKVLAANLSLMVTMMVSGLWHGTTLSFFLFGLVHGIWFVIYRTWDAVLTRGLGREGVRAFRARRWVHAAGIVLTFNATAFAFIFFQLQPDRVLRALQVLVTRT